MLLPLEKMWDRVRLARNDADTTLFLHLLYAGEFLTKLVTAGIVAAIDDDRERHRYGLVHGLLRSDGLGAWTKALDEALIGPASQHLLDAALDDRRHLTERLGTGTWQHQCVHQLSTVLRTIAPEADRAAAKVSLRQWFCDFATLRNKTRGHGAPTPATCAKLCPSLEQSIRGLSEKLPLLNRPWAYLHRNLSGKFRVMPLGGETSPFDSLKTTAGARAAQHRAFTDGIHVYFDEPVRVELMETNVDVADFYFPNGSFSEKKFELLSLISDNRKQGDATAYMAPAGERPASETEGKGALDVVGSTWTNVPVVPAEYIERPALERDLYEALRNDRHPVITLVGRGGIGKTSVTITVLNKIALEGSFEAIFWFSARDIDLLPEGPKVVKPRILSQNDMGAAFVTLLEPAEAKQKGFKAIDYFASSLTKSPTGGPILFVFDNFETVTNPGDLFEWLDTHIRLPNKILITSRYREFKADFPIEVGGMTESEADKLMNATAARLGISELLTQDYKSEVYEESDGHPYIIKVLLGDVAKARRLVRVERLVAGKDDILDALFERTYAGLRPVAKRVFLTLCGWRSVVPQLALEAILLRPANERMDVGSAVEELISSSFVDRTIADDGTAFLDVALVAAVFGRKKLELTPMKAAIDADIEFLQQIGATSASAVRHGLKPRLDRLFQNTARRLAAGQVDATAIVPSLEFICRHYPAGWLALANLHEELGGSGGLAKAAECYRRFLEHPQSYPDQQFAWDELARIYQAARDWTGAAQAQISRCKLPDTPYSVLSNTANWLGPRPN